ncbi:unnamed protein product [Ranitomeya imitator]|uniref:G-protein coupled receptors family 1 profile domain-containing protein n=1 Tax=Ranitomeya imitator TaxID=111125 RepID=A0ABN9KTN0_9NEOB|nr:unnamed protein product [Ranitomeya imitator]
MRGRKKRSVGRKKVTCRVFFSRRSAKARRIRRKTDAKCANPSQMRRNIIVLWSTCRTTVLKSVTNRFMKNLACSGICASLVCVPFDIVLSASPQCCWWIYTILFCKIIKFLHKVFCSVTILSFAVIALDRALSASQKKKVVIAALRTPQNSISIPYVSQKEAELHAMLLSMVLIFILCSVPYLTMVVYRTVLNVSHISDFLMLTAIWLPKVSLVTNPLLFLTVNKSVRKCVLGTVVQLHRRYSRRNVVNLGSVAEVNLEPSVRSGSQLLEMFHLGQQQIFKSVEEEEDNEIKYSMQFGYGPFELPPQWLSDKRNSKKRLLPPLGNTPEELIQTKQPKCKAERKISRNNKVCIFPKVDS